MKKFLLIILVFLTVNTVHSQKKYNVFENRSPLIERLEFKSSGMKLTLSKKGIAYVQKNMRENPEIIAHLVKKLHNEMVGGSSKLKIDCIATQIYWHCLFYDLKKSSESKEDNYEVLRYSRISKQLNAIRGYQAPRISTTTKFNFLSNKRMGTMEVAYVELFLNGCKQGGKYVVPPNIVSMISKFHKETA